MKHGNDGFLDPVQQVHDPVPVVSAVKTELMLDDHNVDRRPIDQPTHFFVIVEPVLSNLNHNFRQYLLHRLVHQGADPDVGMLDSREFRCRIFSVFPNTALAGGICCHHKNSHKFLAPY
ncbi:hypothetical protein [Paenibacillus cymbidii]|uniref:hypothetical protein n=1 Tax=Paenibacillus cymbidii TaxID=1639034 RepID=UPI0014367882|nr:hypothetical protein [Paenibacillus cymbidii]